MKVVIDTNVLISGLLTSNGPPSRIIDLWISDKITVFVSLKIIEEYISVLLRPKFARAGTPKERYEIISELMELENTLMVYPELQLNIITKDPDDNKFLTCAVEAQTEVLISGDEHLLNLAEYNGILILKPIDFLQRF